MSSISNFVRPAAQDYSFHCAAQVMRQIPTFNLQLPGIVSRNLIIGIWSLKIPLRHLCVVTVLLLTLAPGVTWAQQGAPAPPGEPPFAPRQYVAYRARAPLQVDGRLDEAAWQAAKWTAPFVDIVSADRPAPRLRTRVKMLWDDEYFYVAAQLEEPDVWATLTQRDTVLYYDNDFEVFIDPNGDTHNYYELEVNALKTVWDLMLLKPYRDGGPAIDAWDMRGLKVGVAVAGTLNEPGDRDRGWAVEIALSWNALEEAAPEGRPPVDGEQWRVNFSRVQWRTVVEDGRYRKKRHPEMGEPLPAQNWVWSPQGAVNMHRPERWGYVQFSGTVAGQGPEPFVEDPNERVKGALRRLYYRQRAFREVRGHYAFGLKALDAEEIVVEGLDFAPRLWSDGQVYVLAAPGFGGTTVYLRSDGKVWVESSGGE